jgi:two-component system phosphate regulon response regulator PhoB
VFPLIFLIEDGASNLLSNLLHAQRYAVRSFPISATAVLEASEHRRPAIFLIDAPLEAGLELCVTIRGYRRLSHTPVLIVSEKSSEDDRIRGFGLGVDDFVDKPIRPREIVARINAVIRRSAYRQAVAKVEVGAIQIDSEQFKLSVHSIPVDATATQVRLVEFLMRNAGKVFNRDEILDAVWSDSRFVTPRTVDVHIRRIRQLIEANPSKPTYLKTVRGAGYCFVSPAIVRSCAEEVGNAALAPTQNRTPYHSLA